MIYQKGCGGGGDLIDYIRSLKSSFLNLIFIVGFCLYSFDVCLTLDMANPKHFSLITKSIKKKLEGQCREVKFFWLGFHAGHLSSKGKDGCESLVSNNVHSWPNLAVGGV